MRVQCVRDVDVFEHVLLVGFAGWLGEFNEVGFFFLEQEHAGVMAKTCFFKFACVKAIIFFYGLGELFFEESDFFLIFSCFFVHNRSGH